MGMDIGPLTINKFKKVLSKSNSIIWNGPVGACNIPEFSVGSKTLMKHISSLNATTIIGGGSTAECCINYGCDKYMDHVSTGGGASLYLLEGRTLPGIDFIQNTMHYQ
jgi:phosphoglycerate kinase